MASRIARHAFAFSVLTALILTGCTASNPLGNTGGNPSTTGGDPASGGGNTANTGGDVSARALSFAGSLDGSAVTATSTQGHDAAVAAASARGKLSDRNANGILPAGAVGWLEDLAGNRLHDAAGKEYPTFSPTTLGLFHIDSLPVGVDFVLVIDVNTDGTADMRTIINIPKDANSSAGKVEAIADPLSTLVLARIHALADSYKVKLDQIGISPSALIQRIRDAYENLFGDAGIDNTILLDNIRNLSSDDLAKLFSTLIPDTAQRGMQMAEGNLGLANATDVSGVLRSAARILVLGGFAIADDPGGEDLSFLAGLPNVEAVSFAQFFGNNSPPPPPGAIQPTIYRSKLAEVDRNFVNNPDEAAGKPGGPIFSEHVLTRIAALYLKGRTISLAQLHRLIVDANSGMAARLKYERPIGPNQPPVSVFEGADGKGVIVDLQQLFTQAQQLQLGDTSPGAFAKNQAKVRQLLQSFLSSTAEPAFARIFDGILMDRVGSPDEVAKHVRDARAHLPFSRSGPASFFALATADSFRPGSNAVPVTVTFAADADGNVSAVTYDPAGNGKFYVAFGPMQGQTMLVTLINRQTGRPLQSKKGQMQQLDIMNAGIFASAGGKTFADAFSESGVNFPGAPGQALPNPGFNPNLPPDPKTNPPVFQPFLLVDQPGPNGKPVKVDYTSGVATLNANGRYFMQFDPETPTQGKFALITAGGEQLLASPPDWNSRVLVRAADVQGGNLAPQQFRHYFGIDAPNQGYDPTGAPYYDDINNNAVADPTEPTFSQREFLNNPSDWHSTRIEYYYRRADNNSFPARQEIDFGSPTPRLLSGVALVPRNIKPRLNAFKFGKPNVAVNLLSAFSPPEFFDGTHALNADTRINPFTALALVSLVFDSVTNVNALVDFDGPGGQPEHAELLPAHYFTPPIGDPVQLMADGFEAIAQ